MINIEPEKITKDEIVHGGPKPNQVKDLKWLVFERRENHEGILHEASPINVRIFIRRQQIRGRETTIRQISKCFRVGVKDILEICEKDDKIQIKRKDSISASIARLEEYEIEEFDFTDEPTDEDLELIKPYVEEDELI